MAKMIAYGDNARKKILKGLNKLANAVVVTMGPGGRNVTIGASFGTPKITKDGVTVAKEIELENPLENVGAQLVKEAATKTNDMAGDGTTTATLLAQKIANEGYKYLLAGVNPVEIKRGIDKAVDAVVKHIKATAKQISDRKDLARVASISANNDSKIGDLVAEVMDKVGSQGVVTVEEGKGFATEYELVEGMRFDRGYISPYFVTDPERLEAVLEKNVRILVTDQKISNVQDLAHILEVIVQNGNDPLLIIADDVDGQALATLVLNKLRGVVKAVAVKAPGFGDRKKELLKDIAVLTGATYVSEELGKKLADVTIEDFGLARKVIVDKENTTIVDGKGKKEDIDARIEAIKAAIERTDSDYEKEKLQERLAKLTGGVAVIKVGAATEAELKELKYRIEDALNATRAALEEGIVAGGGMALFEAREVVQKMLEDEKAFENEAQRIGAKIILEALAEPVRQIAKNSGKEPGEVFAHIGKGKGYDARTDSYVDMIKAGIIDPAKVVRLALQFASSSGAMILTTEALIVDKPEKKDSNPGLDEDALD